MEFAVELMHTSKAFHSMVCNRLEVICHEDLDTLAAPHLFQFVAASLAAWLQQVHRKQIGAKAADLSRSTPKAAGGLLALARLRGITHESILKFERFPYEVDLLGRH
jgi:hypothetical protein